MMHTPENVSSRFADYTDAAAAADELRRQAAFSDDQVDIIEPQDPAADRKFLPDSAGVRRSLVHWHLVLGAAGFAVGLLVAVVTIATGTAPFDLSPGYTLLVTLFFGTLFGLLLGGAVSARPGQGQAAAMVKDDSAKGYWTVVVHCRNREQSGLARRLLDETSARG